MRTGLTLLILAGFAGLAVLDAAAGNYAIAVAAACLGVANTLLFLAAA